MASTDVISCGSEPWKGIPVKIQYAELRDGDLVTLEVVLHNDYTAESPLERTRVSFPHTVTTDDVTSRQVRITVPWSSDLAALTKGSIVARYTVERAPHPKATSVQNMVKYNRIRAGNVCGPDN
ncbi:hypothetical protein [Streptomyces sp. NPDC091371]|uniref:hypothetical protein n=1 Tax=Streptomyces sp. NPDC091371 TaxID=3155303 RepID=UPI00342699C6